MYDIFFAVTNEESKNKIRLRFPLAKFCLIDDTYNIQDALYSAQKRSLTKMFWFIDSNYELISDFDLNYTVSVWDEIYVHVFKDKENDTFKGVYLIPKKYQISKKESDFMFFVNKKETDIAACILKPMDIFFISYDEVNAEENWLSLKEKYPNAKRIHKVKGIHQAHIEAAKQSSTSMFWVVDGDAIVMETFDFNPKDLSKSVLFFKSVHVYQSINPINDLIYGYGGVKLLPKIMTMNVDTNAIDMTTSISPHFVSVPIVSNISAFNTDPFNTWKSAFRECVKLSSKVIRNQDDDETKERLEIWCERGRDRPFGEYAIKGAQMGRSFGLENTNNTSAMNNINNWAWLKNEFDKIS